MQFINIGIVFVIGYRETASVEKHKYIQTGEIAISVNNESLASSPLGSCIAVVVYDKLKSIGGIAHILLPGKSLSKNKKEENKYAENAVSNLLKQMKENGSNSENLEFCLLGGANVLKRPDDSIAKNMCDSIRQIAERRHLNVKAASLGGLQRRNVVLDMELGKVRLSVGDDKERDFYVY